MLLCFIMPIVNAQVGGQYIYRFLDMPVSARVAALGGMPVSIKDGDVNTTIDNPSLADSAVSSKFAVNYINYISDVNYGYCAYSHHLKNVGSFTGGIRYLDYGWFQGADETGVYTSKFKAADYAFQLGYAYAIDSAFSLGANLKTIYSVYETYTSWGNAIDLTATYNNRRQLFTASLLMRDIGYQWKPYINANREKLPFDIQLALSKKLKKAPIRFYLNYSQLHKWNLTYNDPQNPVLTTDPLTGEPIKSKKLMVLGDKLGRHVVAGAEFIITKNFNLRIGYNYQRRKQNLLESRPGAIGLSFGAGIRVYKFHISYARAAYNLAGASNHFSLTVNFSDIYKR